MIKQRDLHILAAIAVLGSACAGPDDSSNHDVDLRLEAAAHAMAPAMRDTRFIEALQERLRTKPTGDHEVFVDDIAAMPLADGRTIEMLLEPTGIFEVDGVHIAAPLGVDTLTSGDIRIAWVPVEAEPEVLEAQTASGQIVEVTGDDPDEPLLVIGMNERTPRPTPDELEIDTTSRGAVGCVGACRNVQLDWIVIYDDKEPWYKGDPEIYVRCYNNPFVNPRLSTAGSVGYRDLPHVNDTGKTYRVFDYLMRIDSAATYAPTCYVMERDGGPSHLTDRDDILGRATVRYGDGRRVYYTEDATFRISTGSGSSSGSGWTLFGL